MKVGILTTFSNMSETYSLVAIVKNQIDMLTKAGHEVVLFVNENFHGDAPCEIRAIVPVFSYEQYLSVSSIPSHLVSSIKDALEANMRDIDVCFTHDIVLQDSFLAHNLAIRKVNLPIRWRHWIHSQPNNVKLASVPEGHKIVFLNYADRLSVAERYGTWMSKVGVVYNTVEPFVFGGGQIVEKLSKVFEGKDVKIAYAFCTTRMGAKGVEKLLRLAGKIKANGKSVGICLMNSNANAEREKSAVKNMSGFALSQGLAEEDFLFTSTIGKYLECGVPRDVVRSMFALSNVFIFPTVSECCSMVLLEAMSGENLLVLNDDIPNMKEIGGYDSALYMKFGSLWNNTQYSDENRYFNDWAKIIINQLDSDMPKRAKKRAETVFTNDWVYENQMKDLL